MGDYIGDYFRDIKGDTRSLDSRTYGDPTINIVIVVTSSGRRPSLQVTLRV